MKKKKDVFKSRAFSIVRWIVDIAFLAFIVVMIMRKEIFPEGSFLNIVFDEESKNRIDVKWFGTFFVVILCLMAMEISRFIAFLSKLFKSSKAKTILLLVGNGAKYLSGIMILFLILSVWGVNTTAIVTSAGILTLAISLGCQSMVSDIVSGIFMLFEGDIKVGDIVVVDGWRGTVQQIGIRRTRIVDVAGNVNIINNSSITNIINNTQDLSVAICEVGIEYGEDLQKVESLIKNNLENFKNNIPAIKEMPEYLGVSSLGASSVSLKIIAKCKEEDKYQTERDLNREIKLLFDKNNITIPFQQIVLNYADEDNKKK